MTDDAKFPCPCCGYGVFEEPPGSERICPVCFWYDAAAGLKYAMERSGGPNCISLRDAQLQFEKTGFSEPDELDLDGIREMEKKPQYQKYHFYREQRHQAHPHAIRDSSWRKVIPSDNFLRISDPETLSRWPEDMTSLYYWRTSYWLKSNI